MTGGPGGSTASSPVGNGTVFEVVTKRLAGQRGDDIEDDMSSDQPHRPRIGLALGGGAARGWAHIGVLRALDEAGIVPDVITGTSIGAVVGGCYLAGHLGSLEEWARSITRRKMLSLLDVSFGGSGLISGSKLVALLEGTLQNTTIEDLDRPFVCVATEIGAGHEVWLRNGPLAPAMRASFALPGLFEPIFLDGRWLVDGALVNPVPVSACRALDARCVIAVNLHNSVSARGTTVLGSDPGALSRPPQADATPRPKNARTLWRNQMMGRNGLPGIPGVMIESFNIIQDRISRSRLAGDPPDVLITPRVGSVGLFDFHCAAEAIEIGYENARRMMDDIHAQVTALAE